MTMRSSVAAVAFVLSGCLMDHDYTCKGGGVRGGPRNLCMCPDGSEQQGKQCVETDGGSAVDSGSECEGKQEGDQFCRGDDRVTCGPGGVAGEADACPSGEVCMPTGNDVTCVAEPDECTMHPDDCEDEPDACVDAVGSSCQCPEGYEREGEGAPGCSDKNECASGAVAACGAGATRCTNEPGSYTCSCAGAYLRDPDGRGCHVGAWGTATLLQEGSSGSEYVPQPVVASDDLGNVIAVWSLFDGARWNLWANRYASGGSWDTATLIETDGSAETGDPAVAVDPSGNAVAVWRQGDDTPDMWANRYTSGGSWGTATLIETDDSADARVPAVAVDPSGNAVAVWNQHDGTRYSIWANRYTSGGSWGTATLIETDNRDHAGIPAVAVDPSGNAVAVWSQSDGMESSIWSNRYTSGGRWGTATLIETDNAGSAGIPAVAVDTSGNAVAVWKQNDGVRYNVWSNRYTSGGRWGTATLIETDNAGGAGDPAVAVDPSGNAIAVWPQSDGTRDNIWSNRYTSGGSWGTAALIETDNLGNASAPAVAIDPSGNAVAVWSQSDGTRDNIWANRYTSGGSWRAAALIETDNAGDARHPAVAVDPSGNAVVVWAQQDDMRWNIWANRFE